MRHTRNRQLAKLHNEPMWFWKKEGTDDIRSQRLWMKMGLQPKLDPTFEWEREMNRVQWSYVNRTTHTTRFALLKYPEGVKK
ncbi:hypothetical protein CON51_24260 [Bacillus thuringiensis]|uniref:hypothetical protein n=1 Tax=Bacillus thuringiensis TaxID=1428 RepID=UPI000BEDE99A|nr:hypothetical protein [Bacillus thuringiensis]PEF84904.1 hypothetical protein CON51_24260 [Bacillus thuringiensis]